MGTRQQPRTDAVAMAARERDGAYPGATAGRMALQALASGSGEVMAVFERSVYLDAGELLLCVGDAGIVPGPLNLCLHGEPHLEASLGRCRPGGSWACSGGRLLIDGVPGIDINPLRTWVPAAVSPPSGEMLRQRLRARRAPDVAAVHRQRLAGASGEAVARALREGSAALSAWLREALRSRAECGAAPYGALGLLGCGPGLTPSGDDMLAGALVTLSILARRDVASALGAGVRREMGARTSRISAAHLEAACRGEAVAPVHAFVDALLQGDEVRYGHCLQHLCSHGRFSGADAVAGIWLAAAAVAGT